MNFIILMYNSLNPNRLITLNTNSVFFAKLISDFLNEKNILIVCIKLIKLT